MRYAVLVFLALALAACVSDMLRPAPSDRQQEQDERFQQQHRATLPDSF
jgi:hypothetical protein